MKQQRFLVDVGMRGLPFPLRVNSKADSNGQFTIADISIYARIMHEFEARWIDKFIQIAHQHRERIGCAKLRTIIFDYLRELRATNLRIDFQYSFFVSKVTPISKEECLVRYHCTYSAKVTKVDEQPIIMFRIEIPVITTYPASAPERPGGLFGQLSIVTIETESKEEIYPEDLVEITDRCALAPIYSFLTQEDQIYLIQKIHSEVKTSVEMTDEIRKELRQRSDIERYSVYSANFGMLHSYSTVISTERSRWVPFSGYEEEI